MPYKIFFTLALIGLSFQLSLAQSITLTGRVIDDDTEEGLPFCNVYFEGTTRGVSTDIDGYYTFSMDEKVGDSLSVRGIGYVDRSKPVGDAPEQTLNFRMKSSSISFDEVVVLAGENPANDIIRGIIKNKPKNNVEENDTYKCESYSKLELDLDNLDRLQDRKILKQFDFVFDNIDSISDVKPFLPAFITETLYDVYYVKGSPIKEMPKAIQVSGMQNQSMIDLLTTFQEKFNIYDNWINILGKQFISPFSNSGLAYYEYYIQDTMNIDGFQSIKLKFKPKRKQENTFYGDFWVADSLFALQRVNMRMSEDVNLNLVHRIIIYQEFKYKDSLYLPSREKAIIDFAAIKNAPGLIGRRTSSYRDFELNVPIEEDYKKIDTDDYSISELERDPDFWVEGRHEKLTETEQVIYSMVDSIKNVPVFKTYSAIFYTIGSGWKTMGPLEIGNLYTIYSSNDVEGQRLRLDLGTSNALSKRFRLGIYGAYGFKDKKFKYGTDFQWNIRKGLKRTVLGGAYKNDISYSNNSSEEFGDGNVFSSLYRNKIPEKLLKVQEGKLFLEHVWRKGWSNRLTILHRKMDPFGFIKPVNADSTYYYGFNYEYLPDPNDISRRDTTVAATEIVLNTRYALRERVLQGEFDQVSLGSKFPILTLQLTFGIPNVLKSEQAYQKVTLGIEHYFYLNPIGWTEYDFKIGKVFGRLPYLLLETHPGNETFFFSEEAFNSMNRFEFASDAFASLHMSHHFDGFFFNRIPLVRKLDLRLVTSFKAVIGVLSDKNKEVNRLNYVDLERTRPIAAPGPLPYMEAGVGIENILKLFRVEGVWRLTYLDNANIQKFSVRVGIDFNF